jgi:hypothetical protein
MPRYAGRCACPAVACKGTDAGMSAGRNDIRWGTDTGAKTYCAPGVLVSNMTAFDNAAYVEPAGINTRMCRRCYCRLQLASHCAEVSLLSPPVAMIPCMAPPSIHQANSIIWSSPPPKRTPEYKPPLKKSLRRKRGICTTRGSMSLRERS